MRKLLQRALDLEDETAVQIRSLADSPYDESEAVATLTFSEIPPKLSTPLEPPKITFTSKNILPEASQLNLILDTHFHEFTVLHCPEVKLWNSSKSTCASLSIIQRLQAFQWRAKLRLVQAPGAGVSGNSLNMCQRMTS